MHAYARGRDGNLDGRATRAVDLGSLRSAVGAIGTTGSADLDGGELAHVEVDVAVQLHPNPLDGRQPRGPRPPPTRDRG